MLQFQNLLSRMTVGRFLCEDSHSNSDDEGGDNVEGVIESTVVESREGEVDDGWFGDPDYNLEENDE